MRDKINLEVISYGHLSINVMESLNEFLTAFLNNFMVFKTILVVPKSGIGINKPVTTKRNSK